jgi:transcriptional regulator with XRE-family HTH domain
MNIMAHNQKPNTGKLRHPTVLGVKCRLYRMHHEIPQHEFAKMIGVLPCEMSDFETGKSKTPNERIARLVSDELKLPYDLSPASEELMGAAGLQPRMQRRRKRGEGKPAAKAVRRVTSGLSYAPVGSGKATPNGTTPSPAGFFNAVGMTHEYVSAALSKAEAEIVRLNNLIAVLKNLETLLRQPG